MSFFKFTAQNVQLRDIKFELNPLFEDAQTREVS